MEIRAKAVFETIILSKEGEDDWENCIRVVKREALGR